MKKILLLLILAFSTGLVAQNKYHRIDSLLNYLQKNDKFMGSVSIREGDKVVFSKGYGFADLDQKVKADNTTKYKIGSITKTFTAVMTMQLIEENKLRLDTKISKYYPKLENADKISIEDLLHHRSGIKDYINQDSLTQEELDTPNLKQTILNKIINYPSIAEPNTKFEYSNSNYYLLGSIIERLTKKTFAENLEDRIVKKIGLKNTYYPSEQVNSSKNESYSYLFDGTKWEKFAEWKNDIAYAAGAIISTPNDLTSFYYELFEGKLVKKKSLESMELLKDSYGKALMQMPFGERKFFGHTGGIEGFRSVVGYYPTEKLGISLIVNGDNFNRNDIMIGILSMYYKMPFPFPNFEKINPETIKAYSGVYSSKDIPLKITVFEKKGDLLAQATGQSSFPLTQKNENTFIFQAANIELEFGENSFILKQAGQKFNFVKE
uniref:serine hydrolase domain-containing protein n=1 Tax=Flavobacterium sp. TaxID=239 RepID=UPI004049522B